METKNFWYSYNEINSYNCLFNFIMGVRGYGKTFAFKEWGIRDALENGKQFMYLRRTQVEMNDSIAKFFNEKELLDKFPKYAFKWSKETCYAGEMDADGEVQNWEVIGYSAYLSNARKKKSISYEGVNKILFDEFLVPGYGMGRYLPDEVMVFLDFYETVARMRDVKCYFASNALSTVNPYFLYFKIVLPKNSKGIKRISKEIVVQLAQGEAFREAKKETRFGKMIAGTDFEKYAVDNEIITENEDFIEKKGKGCLYNFTIVLNGIKYGIYSNPSLGNWYISKDFDPSFPICYQYKTIDKGGISFKNKNRIRKIYDLYSLFEIGCVRFESQEIKQIFWDFFIKIM